MIVDTSVWIAYLSTSESLASRWLADRIAADSTVIVPEVVMMELLIGKTDEDTAALRRRLLQRSLSNRWPRSATRKMPPPFTGAVVAAATPYAA